MVEKTKTWINDWWSLAYVIVKNEFKPIKILHGAFLRRNLLTKRHTTNSELIEWTILLRSITYCMRVMGKKKTNYFLTILRNLYQPPSRNLHYNYYHHRTQISEQFENVHFCAVMTVQLILYLKVFTVCLLENWLRMTSWFAGLFTFNTQLIAFNFATFSLIWWCEMFGFFFTSFKLLKFLFLGEATTFFKMLRFQ